MFRLTQISPTGGDCTSGYRVILDKEYTVNEFIEAILSERKDEWGSITVKIGMGTGGYVCNYKHGELIRPMPIPFLEKKIIGAIAYGGWSNMNYDLIIKDL